MKKYFLFSLMILICPFTWGQIEYHDVDATGSGTTVNNAINDALGEAIGRINGKSIETESQLKNVEVTSVENNNVDYFASEAFQQAVKSATKGAVSSYEVISQNEQGGLWEVTVRAKVAKYKRSSSSNRKRIAVMPLWSSSKEFSIDGQPTNADQVLRILGQNLVSQLVQSRKFTVLDREFIEETVGEKAMITNGDVSVDEMAKMGQELVADYILVGILENLSFQTSEMKMRTSDRTIKTRSGLVEMSYRIIDVPTRQIKYADHARINITEADLRNLDNSLVTNNIDSAMTIIAADAISKKVLNAIYPMLVVSVRGESVTLNQGGEMLKVGDQFEVFEYGEKMIDPYTKESLGREEVYRATIELSRVNPKSSYAKIIESEVDLSEVFRPKGLVCRPLSNQENQQSEAIKEVTERQKKRSKSRDEDW
jgi:curli biogenesis system outer membrane secretion channel CsgG